jgi:hypothetical protein
MDRGEHFPYWGSDVRCYSESLGAFGERKTGTGGLCDSGEPLSLSELLSAPCCLCPWF